MYKIAKNVNFKESVVEETFKKLTFGIFDWYITKKENNYVLNTL